MNWIISCNNMIPCLTGRRRLVAMANQQHLDLLRQGVEGWNRRRKENLDIKPDLDEANLSWVKLCQAVVPKT